jgi:DNA-binding Xre family transcriptional regulator
MAPNCLRMPERKAVAGVWNSQSCRNPASLPMNGPNLTGSPEDTPAPRVDAVQETPIRGLRRARGLSHNQLAAMIGMDPAHLDLIERQSPLATPTLQELEAIARILSCRVEDLR